MPFSTGQHTLAYLKRVTVLPVTDILHVRLVDGSAVYEGRLEVQLEDGSWGTVCDDTFDDINAAVVCRQLGMTGGVARSNATYGPGTLPIVMADTYCLGTESTLGKCSYSSKHTCTHSNDVGVQCTVPGGPVLGVLARHAVLNCQTSQTMCVCAVRARAALCYGSPA